VIVIQGKRGKIEIVEPVGDPNKEYIEHFYRTFISCLIEIQREQEKEPPPETPKAAQ
jgi:hypothetical protein